MYKKTGMRMSKDEVQKQFGAHADAYRTSVVHAKGASLSRLVELVQPQPEWQALDIATGGGHTAVTIAPYVAHVVASDLTPEMLSVARRLASESRVANISFEEADAEELPFEDARFDLVTCRIAPHHFPHIDRFVSEVRRVLKPDGIFALVDNVVPNGDAGQYVNDFEKLRDPSHHRALSVDEWRQAFETAGFAEPHVETARKRMEFQPWVERMGAAPDVIDTVRKLLLDASDDAKEYFQVQTVDDALYFYLTEGIFIGCR